MRAVVNFRALSLDNGGVGGAGTALVLFDVDHGPALLETAGGNHPFIGFPTRYPVGSIALQLIFALAYRKSNDFTICTGLAVTVVLCELASDADGTYSFVEFLAGILSFWKNVAVEFDVVQLKRADDQQHHH